MIGVFEVDKANWAFKLAPQLTGKAQQAYAVMAMMDAGDYNKMKAAIFHRYDINEETYWQHFRTVVRKEEESYRQLAIRADDLLLKWTRECKSAEEICHLVAMEQILESLPSEIHVWVRERKPRTATEAGQLADDYVQARRQESRVSAGARSGGESTRGQARGQENNVPGPTEREEYSRQCGHCRRIGHTTEECRQAKRNEEANRVVTRKVRFGCGEEGHIKAICPRKLLYNSITGGARGAARTRVNRRGLVEDKGAKDILLDTGCAKTMVQRELVSPTKLTVKEVNKYQRKLNVQLEPES